MGAPGKFHPFVPDHLPVSGLRGGAFQEPALISGPATRRMR